MGRWHRQFIQILEREGQVRLAAVADVSPSALAEAATQFNDRALAGYRDFRELLDHADVDAVAVVTPTPTHAAIAGEVLRRGRPLLLEKPPAPLVSQLRELMALDAGGRAAVFFQHICSPGLRHLRQALRDGRLGALREIRSVAGWPRGRAYYQRAPWAGKMTADGEPIFDGPCTNAMAHFIHNALHLAGAVSGGDDFAMPRTVSGELYRAGQMESFDTAALRATFDGGVTFSALYTHACRQAVPHVTEARGERGWLRLHEDGSVTASSAALALPVPAEEHVAFLNCYRDFLDFLRQRRPRPATRLADALPFVTTVNAALAAAGGIHSVPAAWVRPYQQDNDEGVDLDRIGAALTACLERGALPSEQGLAWARAGRTLTVGELPPLTVADLAAAAR